MSIRGDRQQIERRSGSPTRETDIAQREPPGCLPNQYPLVRSLDLPKAGFPADRRAPGRGRTLVGYASVEAATSEDSGIRATGWGRAEFKLGRLALKPVVRPTIGFRERRAPLRFGLERAVAKPHRLPAGLPPRACEGLP